MPEAGVAANRLGVREEQLVAYFERRGLVRGGLSVYGRPCSRRIEPGHEPQALIDATARQKRLVEYAYSTLPTGENACAAWVERAFARFGICVLDGHAFQVCESYCSLTDTADLKAGMVVAVPRHPLNADGLRYGHVSIYVGDSRVRDCVGGRVRTVPLELWLSAYGLMDEPRWGWLGSIALDV